MLNADFFEPNKLGDVYNGVASLGRTFLSLINLEMFTIERVTYHILF
jgi:hypothetical protein